MSLLLVVFIRLLLRCFCVDFFMDDCILVVCFFFKQKTAYEVRISDWSSDVCSSDLFYSIVEGIARKRPTIGYLFGLIGWLSRWSAGNALLIAAVILFYRGIRLPRPGPVFQLGLSFNNDRMFRLIHEIGRAHV